MALEPCCVGSFSHRNMFKSLVGLDAMRREFDDAVFGRLKGGTGTGR